MKNASTIPVLNWNEYRADSDFVIKTLDDSNIPQRMKSPHRNNGYKVALLTEGTINAEVDFEKFTAKAPAILFSLPEQVIQVTSYTNHKMIHIAFSKDYLINDIKSTLSCWECMFSQMIIPVEEEKDLAELNVYIKLMQREFFELREQKDMVIRNLLNAFLVAAARLGTCETHLTTINTSQHKILQQFRMMLEDQFLSCTHVSEYADMIYITPGHLNDTIKTITGKTAKQMIDERRITEAKRLLYWEGLTVKEIATHLNFEDDAYFNRFFKKHTGKTPALFQKNIL